ncbi:MAG: hypothetical protein QW231_00390 [Candidatus Bathyarchaeia archaeon]
MFASRVIMGASFPVLFLDIIPLGPWIGPVLSVAGGTPAVSGYVYQAGLAAMRDGNVYWAPQIWYGSTLYWYPSQTRNVGRYDYFAYFVEINEPMAPEFKVFIYKTSTNYTSNKYIVHYEYGSSAADVVFLVGNEVLYGRRLNYFQFGVEASTHIGQVDKWDIRNYDMAYYGSPTGQWKYLPGYSIQGSAAIITFIYPNFYVVGGEDYTNVNKHLTADDDVRWRYTGTTIGNDVVLWSSSGVRIPRPYR